MRRSLVIALLALIATLAFPAARDADSASGRLCEVRGICHKKLVSCTSTPLAIDSQESGGNAHSLGTTSPSTFSFANTTGNELLVGVIVTASTSTPTVSVTYGGSAMTQKASLVNWSLGFNIDSIYWFSLLNPPTGSNTVSVTFNGSPVNVLATAISFRGASNSPVGNAQSNFNTGTTSTLASVSVPGTTNGDFVVSIVGTGTGVTSANGSTVLSAKLNHSVNTASDNIGLGEQSTTGGTVTAGFNVTADEWGVLALEVFGGVGAACTAPPPPPSTFFVATTGSDSNPGTQTSPFLTFGQCQTAMRSSPSVKTCTIRQGTYTFGAALAFTSQDAGELWQAFSGDPANSETVSGGGTVACPVAYSAGGSATSITFTGIAFTSFTQTVTNSSGHITCAGGGRQWAFFDSPGNDNTVDWPQLNSGWSVQPIDGLHVYTATNGAFFAGKDISPWTPTPTRLLMTDAYGCTGGGSLNGVVDMDSAAAGNCNAAWLSQLQADAAGAVAPVAVVRIWQEANAFWMPWSVNQTGGTSVGGTPNGSAWSMSAFIAGWRNMATQVRAAFPHALIEWNLSCGGPFAGGLGSTGYDIYPGDDLVDVVGLDCYEQGESFATTLNQNAVNLTNLASFANAHNKLVADSEWAPANCDSSYVTSLTGFFDSIGARAGYLAFYEANNTASSNVLFATSGQPGACPANTIRQALNTSSFRLPFTGNLSR